MAPNLHVYNDTTFEMRVRALSGRRKREKIGWRRVEAGLTGALLAAACCQALLPVHVDSFSLAAPHTRTTPHAPAEFGSARFGLRLRGGERTPPPGRASASLQACADGGGVPGACSVGPKLFAVEGLIGAGKSTLLAKLRSEQVSPPHVRTRACVLTSVCPHSAGALHWCNSGQAQKWPSRPLSACTRTHCPSPLSYRGCASSQSRSTSGKKQVLVRATVCLCVYVYVCVYHDKWQETGACPCCCVPCFYVCRC